MAELSTTGDTAPSTASLHEQQQRFSGERTLIDASANIHVALTYEPLDAASHMARVRSPKAGAVVLFAGCTRDTFVPETIATDASAGATTTTAQVAKPPPHPVTHLIYAAYPPLALRTLLSIAQEISKSYAPELVGLAIVHRLGRVEVGEESILVAVATPHRSAAWRAAEECLEKVKNRVEIWKEEWVVGIGQDDDSLSQATGKGIWRANDRVVVVGKDVGNGDGETDVR